MKIGLVGWGVETKSAYRYFGPDNQYVIGNEEPRDDFPDAPNVELHYIDKARAPGLTGNVDDLSYLDHYDDCELIIFQGAARKNLEKKFPAGHSFWKKAKTSLDIFFEQVPRDHIIGITGTKGKGTTTSLVYEMLKAAGLPAVIGGNIGIPVLDLLPDMTAGTWAVLELSSFQLYKFNHSPHISINLMMIPEHIAEWHKTMDDYVEAKRNIFASQTPEDIAIYMDSNVHSKTNAQYSPSRKIPYYSSPGAHIDDGFVVIDEQKIVSVSEIGLLGTHNLQNICAAVTAAWQVQQDVKAIATVLRTFKGLEHRLQLAGTIDGVRYYDDSFGTTPDTAVVALDAFSEPKVLIVGGHDKGNDYSGLAARICRDDIRHVVFIGTTADKIHGMAVESGFDITKGTIRSGEGNSWSMTEIVDEARKHAHHGDVVLLSTGSASFGLFKDYKDRGNQFNDCVKKLAEK